MTADQFTREAMSTAEQTEFVELARGLAADQWSAPSLCSGLSVRDIVVHIAAHIHGELLLVIHQQDIRRALGLTRSFPADRLCAVLDCVRRPRVPISR